MQRLRARVVEFRPLSRGELAAGTRGEFYKPRRPRMIAHPVFGRVLEDEDQRQGVIALPADATVGVVAHECGHAVATEDDLARRRAPDDEWASELTADWYAYKWGFGRAVALERPSRAFVHHCVGPGQISGLGDRWYRVSRRFVMSPTEAPAWARKA